MKILLLPLKGLVVANNIGKSLAINAIRIYAKILSPLLGNNCRYYPTCSSYMMEAIQRKGLILGILKGLYRILRCNPFSPGGYDPVDPKDRAKLDDNYHEDGGSKEDESNLAERNSNER